MNSSCRLCLLLALALPICAETRAPAKKATTSSVIKLLLQMERDWSQAGVKKDARTMDRILADDWVSVDFHGKTITKAQAMAELKSTAAAGQSMELGDMKVRVLGDAAVVTGTDSSGKFAWMDVFMKRNGRWQAVASQSTKIEQ